MKPIPSSQTASTYNICRLMDSRQRRTASSATTIYDMATRMHTITDFWWFAPFDLICLLYLFRRESTTRSDTFFELRRFETFRSSCSENHLFFVASHFACLLVWVSEVTR